MEALKKIEKTSKIEIMSSPQVKRGEHYLAARKQWKAAALMVRDLPDPWMELRFDEIQEETVTRHMYNPHSRKWKTDEVVVKIQSEVFDILHVSYIHTSRDNHVICSHLPMGP